MIEMMKKKKKGLRLGEEKRGRDSMPSSELRKALTLSTSSEIPSSTFLCLRGQENFEIIILEKLAKLLRLVSNPGFID